LFISATFHKDPEIDLSTFKFFYKWELPSPLSTKNLYSGLTRNKLKLKEHVLSQGKNYIFKLEIIVQIPSGQNETIVGELEILVNQPFKTGEFLQDPVIGEAYLQQV